MFHMFRAAQSIGACGLTITLWSKCICFSLCSTVIGKQRSLNVIRDQTFFKKFEIDGDIWHPQELRGKIELGNHSYKCSKYIKNAVKSSSQPFHEYGPYLHWGVTLQIVWFVLKW